MSNDCETPRHHAYVLRFWETRSLPPDPAAHWRFSLENLRGQGEHKFPDLETLTAFLGEQIDQQGVPHAAHGRGEERRAETALIGELDHEEQESRSGIDLGAISILLVEEDDAIRKSLFSWLLRALPEGTVLQAESDEHARQIAGTQSPDAILIDVAPPKTDGVEAVRILRSAAPEAQIVALTMEEPQQRQEALLAAGAGACVKIWRLREALVPVLEELLKTEAEEIGKKTVVCIEDEIDMLSLIKFTLQRHNINLVTALGGQEGLDVVQRTKPDLVLLDLMMPEIDGWEVYQRIKNSNETRDIPIIVLTVLDPHWIEKKGMDLTGVADYVTKPFAPQDLVERVGQALEVVA